MRNFFKASLLSSILFYASTSVAQQHQLVKLWETDSVLKVPESVLYHAGSKTLFVSNIDGKPAEKDSHGSIARVSLDGKKVDNTWATGLSAPKGMGIYNNTLFVADVDEVVGIALATGKITTRIPVEGAVFLNDISINKNGVIYVSDSRKGNVHQIEKGKVSTFLANQMGVNGLLAVGDDLYLLVKGSLWKADKSKNLTKIAEGMDESTDGIEQTTSKDFIVSCWSGAIYYVKADGNVQQLLDTRPQKVNSADIGFDAKTNTVYVPTFYGNRVVAYQLK
ncbi:MAG TPA: hypothetical protein VLZ28_05760 [Daejeonella sp.]|nr:hypothetical protein [Daejeonella sp.]